MVDNVSRYLILEELMCSEYDDNILLLQKITRNTVCSMAVATTTFRERKKRIQNYVEGVLPYYSVDDFKDRFRISRETFDSLVEQMIPYIGKGEICVEKKLLIYVKYISTQQTYQALADIFGVCEYSVHKCIHEISEKICKHLLPDLVKWPEKRTADRTVDGFQEINGFPGVIGAIDGSHIPIRTPTEFPENYTNRKGYPSLILQAVCDCNLKFLDVYCGWPGSVHDARVLRNSPLFKSASAAESEEIYMFPINTHLLGDSAYPLSNWLMVPFKDFGNLNEIQKRYNYKHSSTRICIERAFGALKRRFRRLKFVDLTDIKAIVHVVLSCCCLHQLCLYNSAEDILEFIQDSAEDNEEVNNFMDICKTCASADVKRKAIADLL